MAWGALIGLGEGLKQTGSMIHDLNKQKLAEKLEKEREDRAEARKIRAEKRDQASYGETRTFQNDKGVWVQQKFNKAGEPMGEPTIAPSNVADDLTTQQETAKANLENAVLQGNVLRSDLEYLPEKRDLERREAESQIAYRQGSLANEARRESRLARGALEKEVAPSFYDAVDQLIKDSADLRAQYTKPDNDGFAPLTPAQYREVVEESVRAAAQRGLDARAVLRGALERVKKAEKE